MGRASFESAFAAAVSLVRSFVVARLQPWKKGAGSIVNPLLYLE